MIIEIILSFLSICVFISGYQVFISDKKDVKQKIVKITGKTQIKTPSRTAIPNIINNSSLTNKDKVVKLTQKKLSKQPSKHTISAINQQKPIIKVSSQIQNTLQNLSTQNQSQNIKQQLKTANKLLSVPIDFQTKFAETDANKSVKLTDKDIYKTIEIPHNVKSFPPKQQFEISLQNLFFPSQSQNISKYLSNMKSLLQNTPNIPSTPVSAKPVQKHESLWDLFLDGDILD